MSHTYGSGNSNGNSYLNKKRLEEDNPMDNRYHYDKYPKYEKNGSHPRYNNINYIHSKPPQGNNYYSTSSRYRGNYYNNQKPFHSNSYSNKISQKNRKPYQKNSTPNANERIRNLSHCEMPSPPPLSTKQKSDSTGQNNEINIKDINKLVSNFTNNLPSGRGQPIFSQQNINIEIKLTSPSNLKYKEKQISEGHKEESSKWKKEDKSNKDEEITTFKLPKPSEKYLNYEYFNRNSIKLEENILENFELYPKNLYELNINNIPKKQVGTTISESINNDNIENALSIKSCYLLAKIPNWRLVTNFVPASSLTEEKFENISFLEEDKEDDDKTEENEQEKKSNEGKQVENKKKEKSKKSHLVYFEGFEDEVEKYLEPNMSSKKNIKEDIFNIKSIIEQYHYDIIKIKNKLKQNIYKTNYLNIKQENLRNVIDETKKKDDF